jgi:hypothetical protein
MNHQQQPPHDDAEQEWRLQEQALRAERLGLDPRGDATLQRYRTVMRALRQPLDENLSPDFAAQMAARVQQRTAVDTRLELWMSTALLGMLGAILLGVVVMYGQQWLQMTWATMAAHSLLSPWLVALAVSMALPALLGKVMPSHTTPTRRLGRLG